MSEKKILMPDFGADANVTIVKVYVKKGEKVKEEVSLCQVEAGKTTVDIPSEYEGEITEVYIKEGQEIAVDEPIFAIQVEGKLTSTEKNQKDIVEETVEKEKKVKTKKNENFQQTLTANRGNRKSVDLTIPASPLVRKMAREAGIDLMEIVGSGRNNRVTLQDIFSALSGGQSVSREVKHYFDLPDFSQFGEIEHQPYKSIRKMTADHLTQSWQQIPHVTQYGEADITNIDEMRKRLMPTLKERGIKLTPTVLIIKSLAMALEKFPEFNTSLDERNGVIIQKKFVNIGVAVNTDKGLLVPVIRDVNQKTVIEVAQDLSAIAQKARNGQITLNDMQGGCSTVSSLGGVRGTAFTPIINAPEVSILGVSQTQEKPVVYQGQVQIRKMLPLSLSYDHRVIDGFAGASFLAYLCEILENYEQILLNL